MSPPTFGPLARDLVLVLPSGASLTVTDESEWSWIEPPPAAPPSAMPALELRGLVGAGRWLAAAMGITGARVVLRSPDGENLDEAVVTWLGSNAVGLKLLPGPFDLLAYLRGPSRPRAVPLPADELAALVEATRDDDPAGLIPRLLATVAAERERGDQRGKTLAKIIQADDEGGVSRAIGRVLDRQAEAAAATRPRGTTG